MSHNPSHQQGQQQDVLETEKIEILKTHNIYRAINVIFSSACCEVFFLSKPDIAEHVVHSRKAQINCLLLLKPAETNKS